MKKINENANLSDRYYIEAPEEQADAERFDTAVQDMDLVTPESNWYDFDNTFIATVEQIKAMVEDYGIEPIVYENFDEQNGPHGRIYDVYSLVFDAEPLSECVCAGQACGNGTISDFVPENMRAVVDIRDKDKDELKETKEVPAENPANFRYKNEENNIEFEKRNPNKMKVNKKLPESIEDPAFKDGYDSYMDWIKGPHGEEEPASWIGKGKAFWDGVYQAKADKEKKDKEFWLNYKREEHPLSWYFDPANNPRMPRNESMENNKMITNKRVEESFKKVLETKEVPAENPNNYYYGKAEKNIEYSQINPDNMKVNKKLPESKLVEHFDFEDDDDLGYDDFDYDGEMEDFNGGEDFYDEGWDEYTDSAAEMYDDEIENEIADTMPTRTPILNKETDEYDDLQDFESDYTRTGKGDFDWIVNYDKPKPIETAIDPKYFESETHAIPRNMRESRALPGGMLNSEEKTAYEDFLRERHLKQDKVKNKEYGKNKLGLYDDECGENGWHNWDGTKIERKR